MACYEFKGEKTIVHEKHPFIPTKFKRNANTDGMGNCLRQPGQLSNQLHMSMRSKLFPLIKISVP